MFGLLALGLHQKLSPLRGGLLLLTGYALLTPTLHPWYLLWPLLFCPLQLATGPRVETASRQLRQRLLTPLGPVLLLATWAPLFYLPLPAEWAGGGHSEAVWPRLLAHGTAWLSILWIGLDDAMRRRERLPRAPLPS
jgi:hypothetical protein